MRLYGCISYYLPQPVPATLVTFCSMNLSDVLQSQGLRTSGPRCMECSSPSCLHSYSLTSSRYAHQCPLPSKSFQF